MAVAQGYGKTSSSGLVFAYDAADMVNSFKGKPGTNILVGVLRNYDGYSITNYSNGKLFETNGYTEVVNIPTLGTTTVESVEIYNVYSGYGDDGNFNCCPSLFRYSTSWRSTILQGNTNYTYEIVYKCDSGYTHPNYMYHYEYRADSTYNTEFGVHDNSRRTELGDGWYHAWGSFTTQATTADGYFGCWYYNYNTKDKLSIAKISLQEGLSVLPPKQLITPNTTRSMTQGLYDLTDNATISLSNVSFDITGEIAFDGTDDTISVNSYPAIELVDNVSIEYVYMRLSTDPILDVIANKYHSTGWELFCTTANTFALAGRNGDGTYYSTNNAAYTIQNNKYYHLVAIKEGTSWRLYVNGELYASLTATSIGTWSNTGILQIGGEGGGYFPNMKLPILKIYNRVLIQSEISQNYKHYKSRYNL